MGVPNNDFRVNPERSVYVTREFANDLVEELLPQILGLKGQSKDPISVIINSDGGDVRCLNVLNGALHTKCPDSFKWRIITCAVGNASSAGATLLALGDYAIAHPHTEFHFHGIRFSHPEITVERANWAAEHLNQSNSDIAKRVAEKMLDRVMHRYMRLRPEYPEILEKLETKPLLPIDAFTVAIKKRTSVSADKVIDRATSRMKRLAKIAPRIKPAKMAKLSMPVKQDAYVLKTLIDFELAEYKDMGWRLDEDGMNRLVSDYLLLETILRVDIVQYMAI